MSGAAALGIALAGGLGLVGGRAAAVIVGRYAPQRAGGRRVPAVELVMAALSMAVVARFGIGWTVIPPLVATPTLVTLAAVDLRAYRLPDAITLPSLAASVAAVAAVSVAVDRPGAIVSAAAAALGYGAVLWAAHEVQPRGLGFGDVKLGPLLGLHLGWAADTFHGGWSAVFGLTAQALLMSCAMGLATGVVLAVARRWGYDALPDPERGPAATGRRLLDTSFPFGPALAAGTLTALLCNDLMVG